MMREIEPSAGTIGYDDTDGGGPVVALLHAVCMGHSVWRHVVADLRSDHRRVAPTLPWARTARGRGAWPLRGLITVGLEMAAGVAG